MKKQAMQMAFLLVIVVGLVFGIAFASQYLGNRSTTEKAPPPTVTTPLKFPLAEAVFMRDGLNVEEHEWKLPGQVDFWFENPSSSPVQIGLSYQSCKCTKVALSVLPKGWKASPGAALLMSANTLPVAIVNLELAQQDLLRPVPGPGVEWRQLEKEDDKGVTVPADGAGWVRMSWKSEKLGPERLTARVWTTSPESGVVTTLEVAMLFVEPIRVEPRVAQIGFLGQGRSKGEAEIIIWSSTRRQFPLTVEVPADDPFVTCGRPVALTPEECRKMSLKKYGHVLSAYSVPVLVSENLSDGRQMELGLFERHVTLKTEPDVEPVQVVLRGAVRGEVTIGVEPRKGEVVLAAFNPRLGTKETVPVMADRPDLELEVDKETMPSFLEAKLEKIANAGPGGSWDLTVRVLPLHNVPEGTAIFLKTKDRTPRRIRVPVSSLR